MANSKKLRVGWFSFASCEGCTILFTELLNDNFTKLSKLIDFKYARIFKSKNVMGEMDVAVVEGAITDSDDEKKVREIRKNAKRIIAIGACAVTGMPSGQRNTFDAQTKKEIEFLLVRFHQREKVVPISAVVKVDVEVPGCPMSEELFMKALNKYLKEFKVA